MNPDRPLHSRIAQRTFTDHEITDALTAICERLETLTRPALNARVCGHCGGLRPANRRPCDVCTVLRQARGFDQLVEDVEWLLGTDHPASIARRVGYARPEALARRLARHGRRDLARHFDREDVTAA